MKHPILCVIVLAVLCTIVVRASSPELHSIAREFFAWRATQQPSTGDDVNRVDRPEGWVPDWSPKALASYDAKQKEFRSRLETLNRSGWTVADSIDYLLLRSAIGRVDHELNVVGWPKRHPYFYVQQTLGAVYELLLQPPPFSYERGRDIVLRMESISKTLEHARTNLTEPVTPFAQLTITALEDVKQQLEASSVELVQLLQGDFQKRYISARIKAVYALEEYREWLKQRLPAMGNTFAIGREAYDRYLREIALMPYSSDEVLAMGRREWDRSVAFDHYETLRNRNLAPAPIFQNSEAQIAAEKKDEEGIRTFLVSKEILDIPPWMGHYYNLRTPSYLEPLTWLGVVDDLTSQTRVGENAFSYIPEPSPNLSFFRKASAQDPRPLIVHEGVPGHFFHLALSWSNPDSIRRHYVDSGPIEGIGFYAEEMLLQHGLFDDRPRTREIIYRFMRLRALRVDVDVKLACGEYTIHDAARYLAQTVPMDEETAAGEAASFASNPGQAITYQIGKMQIIQLVADAKIQLGEKFNLKELHNYIWLNANVPIALQRWEYLGRRDEAQLLFH
jgi:hypothetical protein